MLCCRREAPRICSAVDEYKSEVIVYLKIIEQTYPTCTVGTARSNTLWILVVASDTDMVVTLTALRTLPRRRCVRDPEE